MPPVSKKNKSVVLFDLASCRESSLNILKCISTQLTLNKPNDLMRLVLLNCSKTDNFYDFSNIAVVGKNWKPYNTGEMINNLKEMPFETDANWLQGIEVATDLFEDVFEEKNVFNLQVFFITDLQKCSLNLSEETINSKIQNLSEPLNQMILYIIGVDVKSPVMIKTKEDIVPYMKQCTYDENNANYKVAKQLAIECAGVMCNLETGLDLITFYTKSIPKQPWLQPLNLGGFLFPTSTSRMLSPNNISIKNFDKKGIEEYSIPPKTEMEETVIICKDDTVNSYSFLGKHFTLPDDVNQSFKYIGERCFNCIGFVNQEDIPELYLGGEEVHSVTAQPNNEKSEAFNRLVTVCQQKKMYGLAYRSYNKNNAPRLYILVPNPPGQFLMLPHPEKVKQLIHPIAFPMKNFKEEPKVENQKLVDLFDDYLANVSQNSLTLHPYASNQIHYKNAIRKLGNLFTEQFKETGADDEEDGDGDDHKLSMDVDNWSNDSKEKLFSFNNSQLSVETKNILIKLEELFGTF